MTQGLDDMRRATPVKAEQRSDTPAKQPRWLTEAVSVTVHAIRGQAKAIADALGVPTNAVYEVADINAPHPLKAWWIPAICQETGSFAVLDAIEARVGRVAFKLPSVNPHLDAMNTELARTIKSFGEFLETNGDVLADGRIERHEATPLLRSLDAILAGVSAYRAMVVNRAERDAA